MNFEWDATKSEACYQQRGLDSAYAARAFFDPDRTIRGDTRHSYGEERHRLMGKIEQRLFVVIDTPRPQATRIISARMANLREVKDDESRNRADTGPHEH
jgi:hypothetical protein